MSTTRSVAAIGAAAFLLPSLGAGVSLCPEAPIDSLSVEEVQELLQEWSLGPALGTEFKAQHVDGFKLSVMMGDGASLDDVLDKTAYPKAQPFDWLVFRKRLLECLPAPQAHAELLDRRALASVQAKIGSGVHVKKENGGIVLGPAGDVQLFRSGDGQLLVNATVGIAGDATISGDLSLGGHLHLNAGNISAANVDDLADSTASLWAIVTDLQSLIDSNAADISSLVADTVSMQSQMSSNTAAISSNTASISSLAAEASSLQNLVSSNAADIAATAAGVADNAYDIALLNTTATANAECCEENSDDIDSLFDAVTLLDQVVNPFNGRVVYQSDFADSWDEWDFVGADVSTIQCGNKTGIGGNLGDGDSISTYLQDMPAHSELTVAFTFLSIDSWDGESAACLLDDTPIWTKEFSFSLSNVGDVCGNGISSHLEHFVTVETDPIEHFGQGAVLGFTAAIDQAYTDETWAVADISVTTRLDDEYTPEYLSDFDTSGAAGWAFLGGVDAKVTKCSDWYVLGGYGVVGNGGSVVKTLKGMGDHTMLVISFEWVKIDTWDGESAKLFVDDVLVWSKDMDQYTGDGSSMCGNGGGDAIVPVTLKIPHDEAQAELRFTSTLNQAATDEAWGLKSLAVYSATPPELVVYETNFDTVGDWVFSGATAGITTCGDFNVLGGYGVLDYDDSVTLYLDDLIPHSTMTVEFDFVKIDSWDAETAYFYVDDTLEWSQTFSGTTGDQLCGSENSNWHEYVHHVQHTFSHHSQNVKFSVTTNLNSASSDESWGIANFKVVTAMEDCEDLVYASDFTSDLTDGWTISDALIGNVSHCGDHLILGGASDFGVGASATKVVDLKSEGNGVIVSFTMLKIDSWDTEKAQLYADGVLVWEESFGSGGEPICGSGTSTGWSEYKITRDVDLGWVSDDTVTLKWTTTLDSAASDEAWGLMDVDVFTYDACDAVAYQSDFRNDDDDGYFFHGSTGGVSYCDGTALLGGYNKLDLSDMVSKLVELPLHTSMKVDFTFVQIDSWDSEYAYFYMDHATKWSQQFSGGATQACGSSSSGWHETFVEKSFTVSHFSPFTWLQWQSALSSAGTDESWGLANVKVTTYMDDNYVPFYQSRFHLEELDGWTITGLDSSASGYFTECNGIGILGGYKTFGTGATATRDLYHLPPHTQATIAWTWIKLDSWDSEYFYVQAEGSTIYSQQVSGTTGDQLCGRSDTNWDEAIYSNYKTIAHTADSLSLTFKSSINSAASDESWALVGVTVFLDA